MGSKSIQKGASVNLPVFLPSTDLFNHACTDESGPTAVEGVITR